MKRSIRCLALAALVCSACHGPLTGQYRYTPDDYGGVSGSSEAEQTALVRLTPEALHLHHSALLIDGHNDLPDLIRRKGSFEAFDIAQTQPDGHTDLERLRRGGVGAQFWSAYVPTSTIEEGGGARFALEQIDLIHRMVQRYAYAMEMAYTADDVVRIRRNGKIASLIGVEGGHAIEDSLGTVRMFHRLGVRYITLTHSKSHGWADSCDGEPRHDGLSPFGEEVIREMNHVGILADISHVSHETMRDVLRVSRAPVIASHSNAYAVAPHPRNVPDDVLGHIADNGGVVMVVFYSGFVDPEAARKSGAYWETVGKLRDKFDDKEEARKAVRDYMRQHPLPRGTVKTLVDHIDHIVRVAGIDHVGIGSDFDGCSKLPVQLEDVSGYPFITQELLNRGYGEADIRKILGENVLRALRRAEDVARGLGSNARP